MNLTTLLIAIMGNFKFHFKFIARLNKKKTFITNKATSSVNAVMLQFRSTPSLMLWSSCAIDFFGWLDLGLSLTLPVLMNLSWVSGHVNTKCSSNLINIRPACNIPIDGSFNHCWVLAWSDLTINVWYTKPITDLPNKNNIQIYWSYNSTNLQSHFSHFMVDLSQTINF